jgi:hypothetical protein
MTVSDAPNCSVTYNHHYDDHNSFIIQATGDSTSFCSSPVKNFNLSLPTFNALLQVPRILVENSFGRQTLGQLTQHKKRIVDKWIIDKMKLLYMR